LDTATPINNVAVRLAENVDQAAVIDQIEAILAPYGLESTTLRVDQPSNAALNQDLNGYRQLSRLMPTLIIIVAAISVYVLMGRMVRSQQPQIGLMKALGYGNRAVLTHYLTFALTIGIGGLLLGLLMGIPLANVATTGYATELGIPLVETQFYPDLLLQGLVISLVAAFFAGLGPAWASAKLTPASAMYIDPATQMAVGRRTLLERVIRLPLSIRLPLRNVFRMRRRSLTTGLGIIFSFVLILMVLGLIDAMTGIMDDMFVQTERWDMTVVFDTPQTMDVVDKVAGWDGVIAVEPLIQLPATITNNAADEAIMLTAFDPAQQMHVLDLPDGVQAVDILTKDSVILTENKADVLGLVVGDSVMLDTPLGEQMLTLVGVADEFIAAAGYISMAQGQAMVPVPVDVINGMYLTVDSSAEKQISRDLYHLPAAAAVQVKSAMREQINELLSLFWAMMSVMLAFVIVMAFALLFNAVTTNVLERQRELATMRSIGTGRWRIAWLISAESFLLWLFTLLPGLALGTWVAVKMGSQIGGELLAFKVVISPTTYLLTAVGILLTML
ncbi:MAG TPA: ABC transporter permease, partial [Anaerolineae bacterium]|nr:ABC transporter permease [Anaerolineae bacterium]